MPFPTASYVGQVATVDGLNYRLDIVVPPVWTEIGGELPPTLGAVTVTDFDPTLYLVTAVGTNTPPAHVSGARYVIGPSPTGAWAGHPQMLAESDGLVWSIIEPVSGVHAFVPTTGLLHTFNGATWSVGTTTINTTTNLPDGDYGDVIVSSGGTVITVKPSTVNGADLGPLNDLSPTQILNLQNTLGTGGPGSSGSATQAWYDPAGIVSVTGPNQAAVFPHGIPLPGLQSECRFMAGVDVLGAGCPADNIGFQFSLDDAATWLLPVIYGSGALVIGSQNVPFDSGDGVEQFLWLEVTPKNTAHGLTYTVVVRSNAIGTDAGPMRIRLVTKPTTPAGTQIKWTTLSIG